MEALGLFNYWVYVLLMMLGLYASIAKPNLVKKVIGLSLFQTGIFIFYISMGVVSRDGESGEAPIFFGGHDAAAEHLYTNPLPHVLILTAIVVSVSTLAVALALIVNIKRAYGTIEADELADIEDRQAGG